MSARAASGPQAERLRGQGRGLKDGLVGCVADASKDREAITHIPDTTCLGLPHQSHECTGGNAVVGPTA